MIRFESERSALAAAESATSELKILRGIIPICAWCKKARAENGDWLQLERYVNEHSEATFSHGICPEYLRLEKESMNR